MMRVTINQCGADDFFRKHRCICPLENAFFKFESHFKHKKLSPAAPNPHHLLSPWIYPLSPWIWPTTPPPPHDNKGAVECLIQGLDRSRALWDKCNDYPGYAFCARIAKG